MKNQKAMMNMVGGLIVGLVLGLLIGAMGAGGGLFGTAANEEGSAGEGNIELVPSRYYRVALEEAQAWLQSVNPEADDDISTSLQMIVALQEALATGNTPSQTEVVASDQAIDSVLLQMHDLLLSGENNDAVIEAFNTCIGFNNDPYTGPGVYLYLEVPEEGEDNVPSDWEAQAAAQDGILWSTECLED
ncbi:MAG: hypothetical protein ACLFTK_05625 [Anaerolineales bacterium]